MAGKTAAKAKEAKQEKKLSLEELFESLDGVVARLEGEDVSLEESFQLYQKGMEMLKECNETIDTVEKKVQILDEDGETHEF
ncbi:exodeoxyribonuclease VII small subunit [Clostridium sp. AF19-22AC]|jgi:exodeoxyribonuclease VII small subunit|uniref:Exodeoxyribonuclease 7 small subunit n=1 Tax=Faecalicatena orotica TaxID=1544 RepID=A0A2Y9C438_9FIRM|nr:MULTISPECIES: exodeoxyribonuclease VII small subunit [Clostridia]PWJ31878.1 exodeoxyribonuclease VII small subunit [Faecalicatena orotica]RHR32405.1 exodeoxyribonuclease VII small subunit [Clostridium sp. AF19-22AC]SSA53704.1 Exodeoxyribonuclease VII small subunit [Faecalicatena orotica]